PIMSPSALSPDPSPPLHRPDDALSVRPHPPRLQHSPSMPNIWFPPHSGPIPARLTENPAADTCEEPDQDVRTPTSTKCIPDEHRSQLASLDTNKRRLRCDTDIPLTPPLTPSSSIRTATSIESSASTNASVASSASSLPTSIFEDRIGFSDPDSTSTRFLILKNVSRTVTPDTLQAALVATLYESNLIYHPSRDIAQAVAMADVIKGVFLRFHQSHGIAVLAFYDVRQAKAALTVLSTPGTGPLLQCVGEKATPGPAGGWLECAFISEKNLIDMAGKSSFLNDIQGTLTLVAELVPAGGGDDTVNPDAISVATTVGVLKEVGALRSFLLSATANQFSSRLVFEVEFYDSRDVENACKTVDGHMFFGTRLTISPRDCRPTEEASLQFPIVDEDAEEAFVPRTRQRSASDGHESLDSLSTSPPLFYSSPPTSPSSGTPRTPESHSRTVSNHLSFDAVRQIADATPTRPRSASVGSSGGPEAVHAEYLHEPPVYPSFYPCSTPPLPPAFYAFPAHHANQFMTPPAAITHHGHHPYEHWQYEPTLIYPGPFPPPPPPPPPMGPEFWPGSPAPLHPIPCYHHYAAPPQHTHRHATASGPPPSRVAVPSSNSNGASNERNLLNLAKIENGEDTRTTVMIKNIPNKMSDKDLMVYVAKVCPRRIDFLYLRMDFTNGCNVGYAFVNFISVQDLLRFAKARLGEKWNMFSSEKVLQMSYANYQGKEALVEKFKNSCIMDEKEEWQPKIFYSAGPEQGLPEPFPAPTHLRRKERSSYNRGPLYGPGSLQTSLGARRHMEDRQSSGQRYPPRLLRDNENLAKK
ncbi:unnamed protein product, partial [Mycena citricolor]